MVCPSASEGQRDLVPLYLSGRLIEEEAEAFEAHYLACAACREEVGAGAALRELYGKPAVAGSERPAPPRRSWLPVAAAAAIALLGFGVWRLTRAPESASPPTLRSHAAAPLQVRIARGAQGALELSWAPLPGTAAYVVHVFAPDGSSVWTSEGAEPQRTIDAQALASTSTRSGAALSVQVEALDAMQRVVATSELTPIPER